MGWETVRASMTQADEGVEGIGEWATGETSRRPGLHL